MDDDIDLYGDLDTLMPTEPPPAPAAAATTNGEPEGGQAQPPRGTRPAPALMRQPPPGPTKGPGVCVMQLAWWTTDRHLEDAFSRFGKVKSVKMFSERSNGESRGYAFLEFEDPHSSYAAKKEMEGKAIQGKPCTILFKTALGMRQFHEQLLRTHPGRGVRRPPPPGPWGARRPPPRPWGPPPPHLGPRGPFMPPGGMPGGMPPQQMRGPWPNPKGWVDGGGPQDGNGATRQSTDKQPNMGGDTEDAPPPRRSRDRSRPRDRSRSRRRNRSNGGDRDRSRRRSRKRSADPSRSRDDDYRSKRSRGGGRDRRRRRG